MAIRFYCPLGHRLYAPSSQQGKLVHCPVCRQRVIVPLLDMESQTPAELFSFPGPTNSDRQAFLGSAGQTISSASGQAGPSPSELPSKTTVGTGFVPTPLLRSLSEELESPQSPAALPTERLASDPNTQPPPVLPENPVLPGPERPPGEWVSLDSPAEEPTVWPAKEDQFPYSQEAVDLPASSLRPPPQQQTPPAEHPGCLEEFFLAQQPINIPPENVFWETLLEELAGLASAPREGPSASSPPAKTSPSPSPPEVYGQSSPTDWPATEALPKGTGNVSGRTDVQQASRADGQPPARTESHRADTPQADQTHGWQAEGQESASSSRPGEDVSLILLSRPTSHTIKRPVSPGQEVPAVSNRPTLNLFERNVSPGEGVPGGSSRPTAGGSPTRKCVPSQTAESFRGEPGQISSTAPSRANRVVGHNDADPAFWPPPKPVDLDPARSHEVRWLGVWLGLIVLFSIGPAFRHLVLSTAPGWARWVVLLGLWELAYVAWMVLSVHRIALWVVMVVFAAGATLSAVTTAFTLVAPKDIMLPGGLDPIRRWAPSWFGCVLAVQTLAAYLAGRLAFWWGEMDRRLARHQQRV